MHVSSHQSACFDDWDVTPRQGVEKAPESARPGQVTKVSPGQEPLWHNLCLVLLSAL